MTAPTIMCVRGSVAGTAMNTMAAVVAVICVAAEVAGAAGAAAANTSELLGMTVGAAAGKHCPLYLNLARYTHAFGAYSVFMRVPIQRTFKLLYCI